MTKILLVASLFGLSALIFNQAHAYDASLYLTEESERLETMEMLENGQKKIPMVFMIEINPLYTEILIGGEQDVVDNTEWVIQDNDEKRDPHAPFFSATFIYGFEEGDEILGRSATCSRWKDDASFCTIECGGGYFDLIRSTEPYPEHMIFRLREFKSFLRQPIDENRDMTIRTGSRGKTISDEPPGLSTCGIEGRTEIRVPDGSSYFQIKLDAYQENSGDAG